MTAGPATRRTGLGWPGFFRQENAMTQREDGRLLHDCEHRQDDDEFAELLEWFVEFFPTTRPGFAVEEPDGSRRTITNEEMGRYVSAANIINYRARAAHDYVAWMRQQQQEASDGHQ